MNERIIELIDIAPKDFWGAQDSHLETIKKYYPKLKIVARGTTLKAFGEKEVLDEFENRFNRLMLHFTRYNNIDDNVIERVIQGGIQEDRKAFDNDKILVHGVGGKIIKAEVPLSEMFGYSTSLRSATQGRATYTMEFKHYSEAPKNVADAIISAKK